MPRKTRHQKVSAELRALKSQLQIPSSALPTTKLPVEAVTESFSREKLAGILSTQRSNPGQGLSVDYTYISQDLKKVAILGTIALLLEVVVSLTLNLGFANLLKDLFK